MKDGMVLDIRVITSYSIHYTKLYDTVKFYLIVSIQMKNLEYLKRRGFFQQSTNEENLGKMLEEKEVVFFV